MSLRCLWKGHNWRGSICKRCFKIEIWRGEVEIRKGRLKEIRLLTEELNRILGARMMAEEDLPDQSKDWDYISSLKNKIRFLEAEI